MAFFIVLFHRFVCLVEFITVLFVIDEYTVEMLLMVRSGTKDLYSLLSILRNLRKTVEM